MEDFKEIKIVEKPVRDPFPTIRIIRKRETPKDDINSIRTDLVGDKGREHIRKVNEGVSKRIRAFMKKHFRFNPENS